MGIKEIALQCGVSASTVSRILRGTDPKCASEALKSRVWQAAQAAGYSANPAARALRASAPPAPSRRIAILLGRAYTVDSNHFFRTLAHSAMAEILKTGNAVAPTVSVMAGVNHLEDVRDVAAVVVIGRCSDAIMKQVYKRFPNLVYVGSNPVNERLDQVICGGYEAAEMAMNKLIYSGHRRIAYVGGYLLSQRYQAYRDAMDKHGLTIDRRLLFFAENGGGNALAHMPQTLIDMADPPTAVFCNNDGDAVNLIAGYKKRRALRALPALISIEDTDIAQSCTPALTSIHVPTEEMGRMAVRILLDRLNGSHREAVNCYFPCRYVERESFRQRAFF